MSKVTPADVRIRIRIDMEQAATRDSGLLLYSGSLFHANPDPDVGRIAAKMLWIHYIIGVNQLGGRLYEKC